MDAHGHQGDDHPAVYQGCTCYRDEVFDGKHERIIDDDRWQLANDLIGSSSPTADHSRRGTDKYTHLLKGLLRYHHCGAAITPYPPGRFNKDGEPYLYYACVRRIKEGPQSGCPLPSFSARHLERSLIAAFAALAESPETMRQSLRAGVVSSDDDRGRSERRLERLVVALGKVEKRIARLIGVFEEQDQPPDALHVRCRDLESERLRLRAEIARLDSHIAEMRAKTCSPKDMGSVSKFQDR